MAAARPPPALIDDLIIEILLRLPPDDIGCLARASLVCKAWRRLVSDRGFFRRYREIHGAPPVLGFLYNKYIGASTAFIMHYVARYSPQFVPTTPTSPFSQWESTGSLDGWRILDCRHGRVLLLDTAIYISCILVWDPVSGLKQFISKPLHPQTGTVLCASNGCDQHDCSYGPFLVVLLASKTRNEHLGVGVALEQAQASIYSSETGKWIVSNAIDLYTFTGVRSPGLLAGDALFFLVESGRVLKYDLTNGVLSAIRVPIHHTENMILCTADDGGLGFAAVEGCSLRLMFSRTNPDGVIEWWQARVIELDSVISSGIGDHLTKCPAVGFAEGTGYIFIRANDDLFSVEHKSGRISKIGRGKFGHIFPLMRFYIPDLASARLQ